jgi:hypothetical protein
VGGFFEAVVLSHGEGSSLAAAASRAVFRADLPRKLSSDSLFHRL